MHYCDCKGTTKLQLLQRVFLQGTTKLQLLQRVFLRMLTLQLLQRVFLRMLTFQQRAYIISLSKQQKKQLQLQHRSYNCFYSYICICSTANTGNQRTVT